MIIFIPNSQSVIHKLQEIAIVKKYFIFYNEVYNNDIFADILRSHKSEVTDMILDEYDEKFHIACEKKLSYEQGRADERKLTLLFKNVVILHAQHFSDEAIAQKLNVSISTVQDILKELETEISEIKL